jgi:hypothetical protein
MAAGLVDVEQLTLQPWWRIGSRFYDAKLDAESRRIAEQVTI